MTFEEYKELVVHKAYEQLKDEPWFKGVCLDTIENSFQNKATVEEAVLTAISETEYWDMPIFFTCKM